MEVIRELCSFEGRGPGTDAERRAANALSPAAYGAIGRRADIEPFFSHPQYAIVHLIHALLGIAGSLLATVQPAVGFALVLFAAASTYLDLNTRLYLVRSLLFRRVSQNVVSPGNRPDAPARLILMAHYDARPHRLHLLQGVQANPPPARAHPPRPRPLPPLLLARPRAPPPHPRRPHGRSRRDLAQRGPGDPDHRPDRRRLPPHRHRPLGDRSRRLRQRVRRRGGPLRGRRADRRPTAEPRRLDRPDRRPRSPSARAAAPSSAPAARTSTAPPPTSSTSTPSHTARSRTR